MKILNKSFRFKNKISDGCWLSCLSSAFAQQLESNTYPLRFSIVNLVKDEVIVEATMVKFDSDSPYANELNNMELFNLRKKEFQLQPFGVVHIVPTGIRCEFGGFAGDATPVTNLLASTVDFLITHPNAVNASELNEMADNILYVEGKCLDDFLLGHIALRPVISNKIGTVVDKSGIEYLDYVLNSINAARSVKGIECELYTLLHKELGVEIEWSESGCAVGTILNPESFLEGAALLLKKGVDAIGGVSVIHGVSKEMFDQHQQGKIPNPSGGVEAIITHLISKIFKVPTAHAPLPYYQKIKEHNTFNPRSAAEFISIPHYFCALKGLSRAPRPVPIADLKNTSSLVSLNNIGAIIAPASCLGGIPALAAEFNNIPLIAVKENKTILQVTNDKMKMANVIEVNSFLEAAGVILAIRKGISLESLRRPLASARNVV